MKTIIITNTFGSVTLEVENIVYELLKRFPTLVRIKGFSERKYVELKGARSKNIVIDDVIEVLSN